ncbi:protein of unknown function [Magnetospirillum sp. XM-1]|nr:protein of unknown function [Magnetospirillum sp. XM-1]
MHNYTQRPGDGKAKRVRLVRFVHSRPVAEGLTWVDTPSLPVMAGLDPAIHGPPDQVRG